MKSDNPRIEIVEIVTGKVIHVVPLKHTDDNYVERVMSGLLRNMDSNHYFAREVIEEVTEE